MGEMRQRIKANVARARDRIARAAERAGRDPGRVTLVAVTKSVGLPEMQALIEAGITHLAENRLQNAEPKMAALAGNRAIVWHMIGPVQRRKARDVAALFHRVDSVDRLEAAEALQRRCEELSLTLRVLLEVNISGEAQKHGFDPPQLDEALTRIRGFDRLLVEGLMTMAPFDVEEPILRRVFAGLRALGEAHGLPALSMGMSQDFEFAVEEGATEVRLGTILFE
jgi:pyridoxal phosphate enzyme (YggS family)